MKSLDDRELFQLKLDTLEFELSKSKVMCGILKHKNLELSQKLLSKEIEAQRLEIEKLRESESSAKIIMQENLKIIAKKKDLKEGWGYNPDSGEIIEN